MKFPKFRKQILFKTSKHTVLSVHDYEGQFREAKKKRNTAAFLEVGGKKGHLR